MDKTAYEMPNLVYKLVDQVILPEFDKKIFAAKIYVGDQTWADKEEFLDEPAGRAEYSKTIRDGISVPDRERLIYTLDDDDFDSLNNIYKGISFPLSGLTSRSRDRMWLSIIMTRNEDRKWEYDATFGEPNSILVSLPDVWNTVFGKFSLSAEEYNREHNKVRNKLLKVVNAAVFNFVKFLKSKGLPNAPRELKDTKIQDLAGQAPMYYNKGAFMQFIKKHTNKLYKSDKKAWASLVRGIIKVQMALEKSKI